MNMPAMVYERIVHMLETLTKQVADFEERFRLMDHHLAKLEEGLSTPMASRMAARFITRRLSSSGKVLGEEEQAAENVYIKKMEREKLEKLARKGLKPEEKPTASSGGSISDVKPSGSTSGESTAKVSTDKYRNYAVVAGVITIGAAAGWYLKSSGKKQEVQD